MFAGDHPRSRGVYPYRVLHRRRWRGSSPLARGLLVRCHVIQIRIGIIPARAGSTLSAPILWTPRKDHPRSRGVYGRGTSVIRVADGSSPLARGLRFLYADTDSLHGIIPARAGSTATFGRFCAKSADHPRSRGVYTSSHIVFHVKLGSSPLARGLPHAFSAAPPEGGIIPARAGSTGAEPA